MKANYIKLFLLLLCGLLISDSIPVQAKEKSWKLVFYDDFNSIGKERFDTTKWIVPDREPYRWSRWISDSKSVVLRRNGKLICRAIPNTAFADQIASRHYADAYAASSKPVISLALEFDRQSRGLIDWKKL